MQMRNRRATDMLHESVDVSVVIPCLNEANSLGICIEKAQKALQEDRKSVV